MGSWVRRRKELDDKSREDLQFISGSTLTLLGLIIGFTFSMAISRYDQRKNYEEEEANAIALNTFELTLPPADASKVAPLLANYLNQRILSTRREIQRNFDRSTHKPLICRTRCGLRYDFRLAPTDTGGGSCRGRYERRLNTQGYTQAAWWNRIPAEAWSLLVAIAVCSSILMGYNVRNSVNDYAIGFAPHRIDLVLPDRGYR